jgi:hypothetical protein
LLRLNYDIKRPYIERMKEKSAEIGLPFFVSDAHHKEASAGGGCCGLPSEGPLSNWNRGQYSEALQIAKANGEVRWSDLEPFARNLQNIDFYKAEGYNAGNTRNRSQRRYQTMYDYMKETWNAVKSPMSPARYFGGALVPTGADEDGNVVYTYNTPFIEEGYRIQSVQELKVMTDRAFEQHEDGNPQGHVAYPIFVTSKGRATTATTTKMLDASRLSYTLVVDPSEAEAYAQQHPTAEINPVPKDDYGLVRTRQYVRDLASVEGYERYWMVDDDVFRFWHYTEPGTAEREPATARATMSAIEALLSEVENVAVAAPDWQQFAWRALEKRKYTLGSRAYLYALILTDTPIQYDKRFEVKSDVQFIIEHLRSGYQTLLLHEFAFETPDMASKSGGCKPAYSRGVQNREARLFEQLYPEAVRVVDKGPKGLDARISWKRIREHAVALEAA